MKKILFFAFWFVVFSVLCGCDDQTTIQPMQEQSQEESIPQEYKNALNKSKTYCEMWMSKQRIFVQLTSEHGAWFDEDSANYAIENLVCDYNANALKSAKTYFESMNMSKNKVFTQLTSEHGAMFTEEEAQFAIDNLE